LKGKGIGM